MLCVLPEAHTRRALHAVRGAFRAAQHCSLNPGQGERARTAGDEKNAHGKCPFCLKPYDLPGSDSRSSSTEYLPRNLEN